MKPFVLIPARGGSKGLHDKNIKSLGGKPLIQYTIEAAKDAFSPNVPIILSTDSNKIINIAQSLGLDVPFKRPDYLALDSTGMEDVISHAIEYINNNKFTYDTVVLLQPTSPFRTSKDIEKALEIFDESLDMVVSVKETKANPYFVLFEEDENGFLVKSKSANFARRQDCPRVLEYNGAIYIINIKSFSNHGLRSLKKVKPYIMENIHSIDIDTPLDWEMAKIVLKKFLN